MEPLISIIIPTKNAEKTIGRTLESLLKQTYKNFEILNIDISNDSTPDIVKKYADVDKRFHTIKSPVQGLAKQRNYGVKQAKGDLIIFIDGDDAVTPTFIETLYNQYKKYNADIVCTNFLHINSETGAQLDKINESKINALTNINTCLLLEGQRNTQLTLCQGKLLKKD